MTQELSLITKASTLVVDSKESMLQAATLLGKVKELKKTVEKEEDDLSEKLAKLDLTKQHAERRTFRLKVEKAIKYISAQVNTYQTLEARKAAEAEAKLAARVEKGTMKLDTAIRKMDDIDKPIEQVKTADGTIKFRTIPKLDITDTKLIPREYLVVDEVKLFADLKAGKRISGAQIIQVQSVSNYAS